MSFDGCGGDSGGEIQRLGMILSSSSSDRPANEPNAGKAAALEARARVKEERTSITVEPEGVLVLTAASYIAYEFSLSSLMKGVVPPWRQTSRLGRGAITRSTAVDSCRFHHLEWMKL